MLEPSPQSPNYLLPPLSPPLPPPLETPPPSATPTNPNHNHFPSLISKRPSLRVTSEFDSDSCVFFHKVSCKLFDNLAKLKLSFINNNKREISELLLALISKYLSIHYDPEEENALIKSSFDVGPMLHFKAAHDLKEQQGGNDRKPFRSQYAVEVSSPVRYVRLPKATIRFPIGEVALEEREEEEVPRTLSIYGILKGPIFNGATVASMGDPLVYFLLNNFDG